MKQLKQGVYNVGKPIKIGKFLYEQKICEITENNNILNASNYARKKTDFKLCKYKTITVEKLNNLKKKQII